MGIFDEFLQIPKKPLCEDAKNRKKTKWHLQMIKSGATKYLLLNTLLNLTY
jgi:hypothetical protein